MLLVLTALLVLLGTAPASAQADTVVAALREDRLLVDEDSAVGVDEPRVRAALRETAVPTYVAIVPQADVDAVELGIDGLLLQVVEGLADPRAVVVVISDEGALQAGEGGRSGVDATGILDRVLQERIDEPFGPESLTGALVDIARLVDEQADPEPLQEAGSTRRTIGLVGLTATVVIGGGGLLWSRAQRRLRAQAPLTDERQPDDAGWH